MITALFLIPGMLTVFSLLAMLLWLPSMRRRIEAPYTPELADAATWMADLEEELAVAEGWEALHAAACAPQDAAARWRAERTANVVALILRWHPTTPRRAALLATV